ncbi:MAG: leucyl aminopeptidase [Candidatus Pseudothioglobus sp.]
MYFGDFMQFSVRSINPSKAKHHCLIVGLYANSQLSETAALLDQTSKGYLSRILKRGDITGKTGETLLIQDLPNVTVPRVLLVGLGNKATSNAPDYIKIVTAAIGALRKTQSENALCCLLEAEAGNESLYWKARRLVEVFEAGVYQFTRMKGTGFVNSSKLSQIDFIVNEPANKRIVKHAIKDGNAVAKGIAFAKDLGNTPGNICTPTFLAKAAMQLAKRFPTLTTTVMEEAEMKKLGMGSLLSVSQGSAQPAKLVVMRHKGGKLKDAPHIIVGKGITFDTGGISLKPGAGMGEMIYDMCGAASVLGTMQTISELNLPINIIGVVVAAENMPSGTASRPGDIVKTMSGQTVEILNTDAEGRLVLCDALTYIDKFNPATVIDIATLTGAAVVALGAHPSAMYANDEDVAQRLQAAGEETRDRIWRMPLWDEYQSQIDSNHADMQNIGGKEAGSITAACFLARFTKKYRWAHLDTAGTAWKSGGPDKGATGRPVNLLCQYLMDQAQG